MNLSINKLQKKYRDAELSLQDMIRFVLQEIEKYKDDHIWINVLSEQQIFNYIEQLPDQQTDEFPLYGIPFAIKDNIDLADIPTTAACPEYSYEPETTAFAVQQLINAGAIPVGKANLDQFATGLVGTRSPYGSVPNSFNRDYIAGGSSSGSAVAVARGLVSFSLGTDTAGSGRIPAAFNNLIGVKPTRGLISNTGVVPACRSLDCVSIFALDTDDAALISSILYQFDEDDPYARKISEVTRSDLSNFKFGIPQQNQLAEFSDPEYSDLYQVAIRDLEASGGECVEIDFGPFLQTAKLLYEGPWVAERYTAIREFIETDLQALFPVTRAIIEPAAELKAIDAFEALNQLQALKRKADQQLDTVDFIMTPTAAAIYKISEVENDPITLNSKLGYYTNFMNLLDYSAIAIPAGFRNDGLPFGITLFASAFHDQQLLSWSKTFLEGYQ